RAFLAPITSFCRKPGWRAALPECGFYPALHNPIRLKPVSFSLPGTDVRSIAGVALKAPRDRAATGRNLSDRRPACLAVRRHPPTKNLMNLAYFPDLPTRHPYVF